ncbi:MAG TPA: site-2 protease family protein [Solirubrobacteraceae bacterium]|nr:site-2 protease family protein [Solirubrobacteraceae bacterium]
MAWAIAIGGIVLLIILHEAGHFAAAKAVGMRVERFSLFFPPTIWSFRHGETEYAIGAIPAGGYVKITGMTPQELDELEPELRARSYYAAPPWKRVFVILAGPGVNLLVAFAVFVAVLMSGSFGGESLIESLNPGSGAVVATQTAAVAAIVPHSAAVGRLEPGDVFLRVDGRRAGLRAVAGASRRDLCAGPLTAGCRGSRPITFVVRRAGRRRTIVVHPRYDAKLHRMLVGFDVGVLTRPRSFGLLAALGASAGTMWSVTESTVTGLAHAVTSAKARSHISGIIGITQITEQAVALGAAKGLVIIAFVSLILAVINLFPFLPLDGGHVLWSVAEKVRGARISAEAMWKFSSVGIVFLIFLVFTGLSNNISHLAGG